MNRQTRRAIDRIERQFDRMEALVEQADRRAPQVSAWSVGEHLDHLTKGDRTIFERFVDPAPGPLPPVTVLGRLILRLGWIPRGRGKAPQATRPDAPSAEALLVELAAARSLMADGLRRPERLADPRRIARHPYFGGLSAAQWLRFVGVHHHHHLKIVRDVLRAGES